MIKRIIFLGVLFVSITTGYFLYSSSFGCNLSESAGYKLSDKFGSEVVCSLKNLLDDSENHGRITYSIDQSYELFFRDHPELGMSDKDFGELLLWTVNNGYDIFKDIGSMEYGYFVSLLYERREDIYDPILQSAEVAINSDKLTQIFTVSCILGLEQTVTSLEKYRGADINMDLGAHYSLPGPMIHQIRYGDTCLHLAIKYGELSLAEMLVKRGADINLRNEFGETPHGMVSNELQNRKFMLDKIDALNI